MFIVLQFLIGVIFVGLNFNRVDGQLITTDLLTGGGCGTTTEVPGGIVVSHQPFGSIPPITNDFSCLFAMRSVRRGQTVRFMFSFFSLSPNDCSMTNLTFHDGNSENAPQIALVCPDSPDVLTREYVSTGRWLTLRLRVSSSTMETRSANFSAFYVSFTEGVNPCQDESIELMCNNGRCIYQVLQCDGLNSCGDNTDELTTAPSFCDGNAGVTGAEDTRPFSNLIPLYIILTLAFAMLIAYIVYILLSYAWFKTLMIKCCYRCFLFGIRRKRKWKEESKAKERSKANGKVGPANEGLKLENVTADDIAPTPTIVPLASNPARQSNGTNALNKKVSQPATAKKQPAANGKNFKAPNVTKKKNTK